MKKFTKSILSLTLVALLSGWGTVAFAQPANNDCAAAVLLTSTVNTSACTVTSGTTIMATQTIPGVCTGNADDDVWYQFVAVSPDHTITVSNPGGFTGITIDARSGACNGTSIGCVLTTAPAVLTLNQLTIGATYLVRVFSGGTATGTFDICVQHPPQPPNDNCAGAINLTPTAGLFTNPGAQSNSGATQSIAPCAAPPSSIIQDVWYQFTTDADGGSATIVITPTNSLGDPVIQAIAGACGSGGLGCANTTGAGAAETLVQGGYLPNTTYRFRVYGQNTGSFPFTVSLTGTAVTPVANDECVDAILLVSGTTCVNTAGTTFTATRSLPDALCLAGGGEDDVWYSFVAASGQATITVSNVLPGAPGTAIVLEAFAVCGGASIACSFSSTLALDQLIEGSTYYIRLYTSIGGLNNKTFNICVTHPVPPANDECATATNVTPTAGLFTNPGAQTNSGATRSQAGATCPSSNSASTIIQDVWYAFTTDADGGVATIAVDATNLTGDPVIHLFGTCAASISCVDQTGAGGTETLTTGALPANTTYRFRVYAQNTANFPFTVSVTGTAVTPPVNNECSDAVPIAISPASGCTFTAVNTAAATQSTPNPTCTANGNDDDVWFTFVPTVTGPLLISYTALVGTAPTVNYEIYTGPSCAALTAVAGSCGAIGQDGGLDDNELTGSVTVGVTYRMRVWGAGVGTTAAFNLCLRIPPAAPAEDECATATLLTSNIITCMNTAGTTVSATSSGVGASACNPNDDDDVWFRFVAVATSHKVTVSNPVGFTGVVIDARSGACPGTSFNCVATGGGAVLTLSSLTIGNTYYLRVYSGGFNVGTFNICVTHGDPLPLELKSFTGKVAASTNVLSWETLTEKNVQSHLVERSADGAAWSEIGRKNGSANSSVAIKYTLEDRAPLAKAYYRLRSVDFDGEENISNTVALSRKGDQSGITSVFPSPTKHNMTVQFNATREEQVLVQIMDMTGRQVLEQSRAVITGSNDLLLVLNTLQAGIYTVKVSNSAGVSAPVRFVKE